VEWSPKRRALEECEQNWGRTFSTKSSWSIGSRCSAPHKSGTAKTSAAVGVRTD
jgi:hypothetical protein